MDVDSSLQPCPVVMPPDSIDDTLSDEALINAVRTLAATVDAALSQLLLYITELDRRKLWADEGHRSCAHWLSCRCGIALGAAREKLRVGRALQSLPKTREAFATGALSYSKARALTRVADTDNEDFLLSIARYGSANHLERLVAQYRGSQRAARREAERDRAAHLADQRSVTFRYDEDGMLVIKARLPPEDGALVLKALERAVEQLDEDRPMDSNDPHENVSAETSSPLLGGPRSQAELASARRADALAVIARAWLAGGCGHARNTADRHHVSVVVDATTLAGGDAGDAAECHITDGQQLPLDTVRRLCCDSAVSGLIEQEGVPLSIGRRSRAIPPAMRRALLRRDRGCRFPGCGAHRFVDGHHIRHWADGGPTSLDNLVVVCGHHHRLLHEGGYSVDANHVFRTPDGLIIQRATPSVSPARAPARPASDWEWDGSSMDWSFAVSELQRGREEFNHPLFGGGA